MPRELEEIEDELDKLQIAYINEDDDRLLREIERKFDQYLDQATALDGKLRVADGVTITNWTRESS